VSAREHVTLIRGENIEPSTVRTQEAIAPVTVGAMISRRPASVDRGAGGMSFVSSVTLVWLRISLMVSTDFTRS
jgi:hypothetical protein